MWVGGQRHDLVALPPGKRADTHRTGDCWPQNRFGQVRKISPLPGFDPRTVQQMSGSVVCILNLTPYTVILDTNIIVK